MSKICQLVVFSNKAYNAIIRESFDKDPVETGGILLGHILENGVWIVMEVLPPGINSIFRYAYFEYDESFVNYLAQSVANQYKHSLDLLGLWHRHPGNMDVFSSTDDETNATFARQNPVGVISGLVNIDPRFRLTMYHMDRPVDCMMGCHDYEVVDVEVGDDIIPNEYFELRYYDGENSNLHPMISDKPMNICSKQQVEHTNKRRNQPPFYNAESDQNNLGRNKILSPCDVPQRATPKSIDVFFSLGRVANKKWMHIILLSLVFLVIGAFTIRLHKDNIKGIFSQVSSFTEKEKSDKDEPKEETPPLPVGSIKLTEQDESKFITIMVTDKTATWQSSNSKVASVADGKVTAISNGKTTVKALINGKVIGKCNVTVDIPTKNSPDKNKEKSNKSNGDKKCK